MQGQRSALHTQTCRATWDAADSSLKRDRSSKAVVLHTVTKWVRQHLVPSQPQSAYKFLTQLYPTFSPTDIKSDTDAKINGYVVLSSGNLNLHLFLPKLLIFQKSGSLKLSQDN